MVHGCLSFGVLLLLDLLLEGCGKVLSDLSIPVAIPLVVVMDFLGLEAVGEGAVFAD